MTFKEKIFRYFAISLCFYSLFMFFNTGFYSIFLPQNILNPIDYVYTNFYIPNEKLQESPEFNIAFDELMNFEGTYSFDKDDPGKETYCGISRVWFSKWTGWKIIDSLKGKKVKFIKSLKTKEVSLELDKHVRDFYYKEFWIVMKCQYMPKQLAYEIFEQSVNLGHSQTIKHIQIVLNSLNYKKRFGQDLEINGIFNSKTESFFVKALNFNMSDSITNGVNSLQGTYYIERSQLSEIKRKYINGWLSKRANFS